MGKHDDAEQTAAREYLLARLAISRGALTIACAAIDESFAYFLSPEDDPKGKKRAELLEGADAAVGEAARALQLAQASLEDIDPTEGEPDEDDEDEEDEEEDDDDD